MKSLKSIVFGTIVSAAIAASAVSCGGDSKKDPTPVPVNYRILTASNPAYCGPQRFNSAVAERPNDSFAIQSCAPIINSELSDKLNKIPEHLYDTYGRVFNSNTGEVYMFNHTTYLQENGRTVGSRNITNPFDLNWLAISGDNCFMGGGDPSRPTTRSLPCNPSPQVNISIPKGKMTDGITSLVLLANGNPILYKQFNEPLPKGDQFNVGIGTMLPGTYKMHAVAFTTSGAIAISQPKDFVVP